MNRNPSMASTSARLRTLNITEVLENILLQLTVGDLLQAEAVCRKWRATVLESPMLQAAKWFNDDIWRTNQQAKGFRGVETHEVDVPYASLINDCNPLCTHRFYQQVGYHVLQALVPSIQFYDTNLFALRNPNAFADEEASWRRMLLFNPPRTKARIGALSSRTEIPPYTLHNDNGLMLEDLVLFFDGLIRGPAMASALVQATVQGRWRWLLMESPDDHTKKPRMGLWG